MVQRCGRVQKSGRRSAALPDADLGDRGELLPGDDLGGEAVRADRAVADDGPRGFRAAGCKSSGESLVFKASRRVIGATFVSIALLAGSACSYSAPAPSERTGPAPAANLSGPPYTYYLIHTSLTTSPFGEAPKGAQLAVDEVNSKGGINGRPLQLKTCPVDLDLNRAANCARQAVADKSVIAANIWLGQPETVLGIFAKAGIPVVGDFPISLAHFSCPVCFPTSSGAFGSLIGAGMLAATQLKASRISYLALDVPAVRGLAPVVAQMLQAAGHSTRVARTVPVPLTAGDLSAQVTAAGQDADAILAALPPEYFPRLVRTIKQLGIRIPVIIVPVDKKQIAQMGPAGDGAYFAGTFNHDSPGFKRFESSFSARYPDLAVNDIGYAMWLGVHVFQQATKGQAEVTRKSTLAALGKLDRVDTEGATPPLSFTTKFTGFGGKIPRLFNNTVVFYQVRGAAAVQLSGFEKLIPTL